MLITGLGCQWIHNMSRFYGPNPNDWPPMGLGSFLEPASVVWVLLFIEKQFTHSKEYSFAHLLPTEINGGRLHWWTLENSQYLDNFFKKMNVVKCHVGKFMLHWFRDFMRNKHAHVHIVEPFSDVATHWGLFNSSLLKSWLVMTTKFRSLN